MLNGCRGNGTGTGENYLRNSERNFGEEKSKTGEKELPSGSSDILNHLPRERWGEEEAGEREGSRTIESNKGEGEKLEFGRNG